MYGGRALENGKSEKAKFLFGDVRIEPFVDCSWPARVGARLVGNSTTIQLKQDKN